MPKVSVLIASRNRRDFLLDCLRSISAQTYRDLETIVVDDGSSDGSHLLAPEVDVYVRTQTRGVGHARNIAIELSKGEYLYTLDSDDWLAPNAIELSVTTIEAESAAMVFSELILVERGCQVGVFGTYEQTIQEVLREKRIPHGSSMIRRATLNVRYDEALGLRIGGNAGPRQACDCIRARN